MSDAEEFVLIDAARSGDPAALQGLVKLYQDAVYRFGRAMCGTPEDAQDVVQDTLMTALQKVGEFRGDASFRTWLYAIARSQCSRRRRKTRREFLTAEEHLGLREMPDPAPLAVETLQSNDDRAKVQAAIDTLPDMYREVLVLRDIEGMTAPQVAETLGLTVEAVKSRLHRARGRIRDALTRALAEPQSCSACGEVVEMLSRHLEGEVTGEDCSTMQAHVDACPVCKDACDSLRRVLLTCERAGREEIPAEVKSAIAGVLRSIRPLP